MDVSNHVFTCAACGRQWTVDSRDGLECFFIGLCYWCVRQYRLTKDQVDQHLRSLLSLSPPSAAPVVDDRTLAELLWKEFWQDLSSDRWSVDDIERVIQTAAATAAPVVDSAEFGDALVTAIATIKEIAEDRRSAALAMLNNYFAVEQSDELVDEVQHRMDQVVDAAVEWHQAGREGGEWFEAAEKLGAAIDSLLELRSEPDYDSVAFTGLRRKEQRT